MTERCDECGDLLRRAKASGGNFLCECKAFLLAEAGVHPGVDRAAGDGVDLDIARRKLLCERARKCVHAAFAGRVGDLAGCPDIAPDRGNIDNLPGLLAHHVRDGKLAGGEYGGQVYTDDTVPFLNIHVAQKTDVGDPGVVDDDVDAAETLVCAREKLRHIGVVRDVTDIRENICVKGSGKRIPEGIQLVAGFRAVDDETVTVACKGGGDRTSDAAGGAGDKRCFHGKLHSEAQCGHRLLTDRDCQAAGTKGLLKMPLVNLTNGILFVQGYESKSF